MQIQNIFLICIILGMALILLARIIRGARIGEAEQALIDSHKLCVAELLEFNRKILDDNDSDDATRKAVRAITKAIRQNHKPGLLAKIADDTLYFLGLFTFEQNFFVSLYSADIHLQKFRDEVARVFKANHERGNEIIKKYPELTKSMLNQVIDDKGEIITIEDSGVAAAKRVNHPLKNSKYPKK